jgi:hypothetical protein
VGLKRAGLGDKFEKLMRVPLEARTRSNLVEPDCNIVACHHSDRLESSISDLDTWKLIGVLSFQKPLEGRCKGHRETVETYET